MVRCAEDFEASIYLTRAGSLHAVLRKGRKIRGEDGDATARRGNSTKLMDAASSPAVVISVEDDDDDEGVDLYAIPPAPAPPPHDEQPPSSPGPDSNGSGSDGGASGASSTPPMITASTNNNKEGEGEDDRKKPEFTTEYEGFTIYDKVLCLVVQRTATIQRQRDTTDPETETEKGKTEQKEKGGKGTREKASGCEGGLIEGWITMSQAVRGGGGVGTDVDE